MWKRLGAGDAAELQPGRTVMPVSAHITDPADVEEAARLSGRYWRIIAVQGELVHLRPVAYPERPAGQPFILPVAELCSGNYWLRER